MTQDHEIHIVTELSSINAEDWNALLTDNNPFLRHEFLSAMEAQHCLGADVGWHPHHFLLYSNKQLIAAMPAYLKSNSFGEFVFDWSWASAYERQGLDYYPKLVAAIPFTPVTGPRILSLPTLDYQQNSALLMNNILGYAQDKHISSFHCLFPIDKDKQQLESLGLASRLNYQYHWHNQNYENFEHYLSFFRSRKRKNVLRERAQVKDAGITLHLFHGNELDDELWEIAYSFYQSTFFKKGNHPALTLAFFKTLGQTMGQNILVILAASKGKYIAGAITFCSQDTLYGRYWGSHTEHNCLHFEVCFYRGIEYCIDNGLQSFEPGAQGEHKITRGFLPTPTWSSHWIAQPQFSSAINDFLVRERQALEAQRPQLDEMSPFKVEN